MTDRSTPWAQLIKRHPETRYLDVMLCDLSCVMRGKRYPAAHALRALGGGIMLPGSTCLLAATGDSHDPRGLGISDGDPDQVAVPLPGTLVATPWARHPTAQVLLTLQDLLGRPYYYEPRNVLARVLERFADLKLRVVVAFELEFYLVDPLHREGRRLRPPREPHSGNRPYATQVYGMAEVEAFGDYLHEVHDACTRQGVPATAISSEYAPGQFEINLSHDDDPLRAADHCVMLRHAVQSVARKHRMVATFMAKPYPQHPGSGMHIHLNLKNHSGGNVFAADGIYGGDACMSDLMRYAIGGVGAAMAESMALFAPNRNAARRFAANMFAPTAPTWGYDNRHVAVRIPRSPGAARRLEHRVAGADANPYLTLAALLAGILHGITNHCDPGAACRGNAFPEGTPKVPLTVPECYATCRAGGILPDYLGGDYLAAYLATKEAEYHALTERAATDAAWYL